MLNVDLIGLVTERAADSESRRHLRFWRVMPKHLTALRLFVQPCPFEPDAHATPGARNCTSPRLEAARSPHMQVVVRVNVSRDLSASRDEMPGVCSVSLPDLHTRLERLRQPRQCVLDAFCVSICATFKSCDAKVT